MWLLSYAELMDWFHFHNFWLTQHAHTHTHFLVTSFLFDYSPRKVLYFHKNTINYLETAIGIVRLVSFWVLHFKHPILHSLTKIFRLYVLGFVVVLILGNNHPCWFTRCYCLWPFIILLIYFFLNPNLRVNVDVTWNNFDGFFSPVFSFFYSSLLIIFVHISVDSVCVRSSTSDTAQLFSSLFWYFDSFQRVQILSFRFIQL